MNIRFYTDSDSGMPHIRAHSVTEQEVEEVLTSPGEDRPGRQGSRVAIGQTRAGRYLRVVYVADAETPFVITAYELTGKPLTAYRRRRRHTRGK
jgi:DMSO/TMAO reductase YedYZ molybdopterin-dependent catalytic subunit